jgi:hypothetical protein
MESRTLWAIMGFGLLVASVAGVGLLLPKDFLKTYIRFFAPLPPIAVAVYVYISKLLEVKDLNTTTMVIDMLRMSILVGIAYFVLGILLYFFVKTFNTL